MSERGKFHTEPAQNVFDCSSCGGYFTMPATVGKMPKRCPMCEAPQEWMQRSEQEPRDKAALREIAKLKTELQTATDRYHDELFKGRKVHERLAIAESALSTSHKALHILSNSLPDSTREGKVVARAMLHVGTARANLAGHFSEATKGKGINENTLEQAVNHRDKDDAAFGLGMVKDELEKARQKKAKEEKSKQAQKPPKAEVIKPKTLKPPKPGEKVKPKAKQTEQPAPKSEPAKPPTPAPKEETPKPKAATPPPPPPAPKAEPTKPAPPVEESVPPVEESVPPVEESVPPVEEKETPSEESETPVVSEEKEPGTVAEKEAPKPPKKPRKRRTLKKE